MKFPTTTYEFSAGIALHGLSLAIPCIVVWSTAFVTRSSPVVLHAETTATTEASSKSTTTAAGRGPRAWVRAASCKMPDLTTVVASTAAGAAADSERWAVGLNVA